MPLGSTRQHYAELSRLYAERGRIISELSQALQAERAALASEKAARKRAERALEESRKAHERDLATRTMGEGNPEDLTALEPGQSPILNLGAWQRGQLGL